MSQDEPHHPVSRSNEALLYAVGRGYRVDAEGQVHGPHGIRKLRLRERGGVSYYTFTVGLPISEPGRTKITWPVDVHRLAGYQKFGDRIFDPNLQVRHLGDDDDPNNSLNNRPENIGIGTQSNNAMDRGEAKRKRIATHAASFRRKLLPSDIQAIRRRSADGETYRVLAAEFGVSKGNISMIVNRKIYREVD